MKIKLIENAQYLVLACLIIAQCVVAENFFLGQGIYLITNSISVIRCFLFKRATADKIKNVACTAITTGLILLKILS